MAIFRKKMRAMQFFEDRGDDLKNLSTTVSESAGGCHESFVIILLRVLLLGTMIVVDGCDGPDGPVLAERALVVAQVLYAWWRPWRWRGRHGGGGGDSALYE